MPGPLTLVVPAPDGEPPAAAGSSPLLHLLREASHRVRGAPDAAGAVEILGQEPFDLVLVDLSAGGADGPAILQHLKWDSRVWHVPVIVVGGPGDVDDVVRCIERGAEDYLLAPLHPVLVGLRLNAFLARRRLQELETEYIKIFDEQSADLCDLKRELARRAPSGAPTGGGPG